MTSRTKPWAKHRRLLGEPKLRLTWLGYGKEFGVPPMWHKSSSNYDLWWRDLAIRQASRR